MSPAIVALLVLACEGPPDAPSVGQRWRAAGEDEAGRQAILAELDAAGAPEVAIAGLDAIEAAAPGTLRGAHCARLREPTVRQACLRAADRPHLAVGAVSSAAQGAVEASPAPAGPAVSPAAQGAAVPWPPLRPPPRPSPLQDLPAGPGCEDAPAPAACRTRAAVEALARGDLEQAAAACNGLGGEDRDECWFRAAEQAARGPEDTTRLQALEGCLAAGAFVHECLSHAVEGWTDDPPAPGDAAGSAAWKGRMDALAAAFAARVPGPEATTFRRVLGACATERQVRAHPGASAGPWFGAAADRRASLAARLLETSPSDATPQAAGDLLELAARVAAAAEGQAVPPATATEDDRLLRDVPVLWQELLPAEQAWLQAHPEARIVPYRGYSDAVRVAVEEPVVDAAIAVLEAAARSPEAHADLFAQGSAHPEPIVRWTAARLAATGGLPLPQSDPDPLVLSRLSAP